MFNGNGYSLADVAAATRGTEDGFFGGASEVVKAAKQLDKNDPGIVDIRGTLSEGVENVIAAVEAEKKAKQAADEPILIKKEKSIEEARKVRERTATAEVRNKIIAFFEHYRSGSNVDN